MILLVQTATDAQKEFDDYIKKMTEEKGFVGGGDGGDYLVEDNNLYSQKQKDAFGIGNPMLDLFGDQFDKYIELKNAAGSAQGSKTETSSVDQAQEALTTNRNAIITLGEIKYPPAEREIQEQQQRLAIIINFKLFKKINLVL